MVDVNGSRFHLLLSEQDWLHGVAGDSGPAPSVSGGDQPDLEWSSSDGLHLRGFVPFVRDGLPPRLGRDDRRGADVDRFGTWWVVGEDRRTLTATRDDETEVVWPSAPCEPTGTTFEPESPAAGTDTMLGGVAATDDHRLVVGLLDDAEPGLLVFDLVAGGGPVHVAWVGPLPFRPIDLATRPGGGVLVLDADPDVAGPARVWPLDRQLQPVLTEPLEPVRVFVEPCPPPEPATAAGDGRHRALPWDLPPGRPTAIDSLSDGTFVVLDEEADEIRHHDGETVLAALPLADALTGRVDEGTDEFVLAHDIAIVESDDEARRLFVSDRSGTQVFVFDIGPGTIEPRADDYPLRRHRGRALVGWCGDAWFDTAEDWYPLVLRRRPRHAIEGIVESRVFDSGIERCRWHRIHLDGCLPTGTAVLIESRAHDDPAAVLRAPWRSEPQPYRRRSGSSLPIEPPGRDVGPTGTWETLLQRADGRYCQLRLTVRGRPTTSPQVHALRLVYPRFSYLHEYLPAVYDEQDRPTRFLERYLANPEGLLTELEDRVDAAHLLVDPRAVPAEHLDWLASWLGWSFDYDLVDERRRLFLRHAVELMHRRGTVGGLVRMLELVLSDCPAEALATDGPDPFGIRVIESFRTRRLGSVVPDGPGAIDTSVVTDPTERWVPRLGAAELHHRFRLFLDRRYGTSWSVAMGTWVADRSRASLTVSPTTPSEPGEAEDWRAFLGEQLGLREVRLGVEELPLYRRFLLQRYGRVERLAAAHGLAATPDSFDDVSFPTTLPATGAALDDWHAIVARAVPIATAAHRFTVLLPIDIDTDPHKQARLVARARRVVAAERPAHTTFDVRPYWAAFRLGDARLGIDTQIGRSSRTVALVVGIDELASAHLTPGLRHADLSCESCP